MFLTTLTSMTSFAAANEEQRNFVVISLLAALPKKTSTYIHSCTKPIIGSFLYFGIEIAHFGIDFGKQNLGRTFNKQNFIHIFKNKQINLVFAFKITENLIAVNSDVLLTSHDGRWR